MLKELASAPRVVGVKQSLAALRGGKAAMVFCASDADPALLGKVEELCTQQSVPIVRGATMAQLGQAAGISVGAAVAAVLKR